MVPNSILIVVSISRKKFLLCYTLRCQTFQCPNKRWDEVVRIRVVEKNWFLHKVWRNGYWNRYMLTYPRCCLCVFQKLFLNTDRFENENCQVFKKFLLTCVLDTEGVQLVKESFSDLIYVPRIDIFHSLAACSWMSLQIESSVEESVTIRTTKSLKDCFNVAHITYMIIVPQQSDSVVVFLQTSPGKLCNNFTIHKIDIIQHNVER